MIIGAQVGIKFLPGQGSEGRAGLFDVADHIVEQVALEVEVLFPVPTGRHAEECIVGLFGLQDDGHGLVRRPCGNVHQGILSAGCHPYPNPGQDARLGLSQLVIDGDVLGRMVCSRYPVHSQAAPPSRVSAARAAARKTLQDGSLGLELFQGSQPLGQLVFGEIEGLEFVAILVFLKRDALRTSLYGVESIALDDKDKSRSAGLPLGISQDALSHGRQENTPCPKGHALKQVSTGSYHNSMNFI